ncbi:hypothetical protein JHK82_017119 [Glycine max]|nr:hypothetical protein JHK82_017119 [Glycine max]
MMPDLGNLSLSAALKLSHCSSDDAVDAPVKTLTNGFGSKPAFEPRVLKRTRGSLDRVKKPPTVDKAFQDRLKDPFLVGAPKMVFFLTIFKLLINGSRMISTMPDLGNLSLSATFKLSHCSSYDALDAPVKTLTNDFGSKPAFEPRVLKRTRGSLDRVKKPPTVDKAFQDRLKDPFLVGAPKMFILRISTMPDLGNLSLSAAFKLSHCSFDDALDAPVKTLTNGFGSKPAFEPRVLKRTRGSLDRVKKPPTADMAFQDRLKDPFLVGAPKMFILRISTMPYLGNLSLLVAFKLSHCSSDDALDALVKTLTNGFGSKLAFEPRVLKRTRGSLDRVKKPPTTDKAFQDRLKDPFLVGAPKMLCFICKKKQFRRVRCKVAFHSKCLPWSDSVLQLKDNPGHTVCWRHPSDWRLDKKEVFCQLPLPFIGEEFKIDFTWKDMDSKMEQPPPYVHIRCNIYLVKKKGSDMDDGAGCSGCSSTSTCSDDFVCRAKLDQVVSKGYNKELMLRPSFPTLSYESEKLDVNTISEVIAIVNNMEDWGLGRLIDLLPPPMGEELSYDALGKDLRPSLDWCPEKGWTMPVPMPMGGECKQPCAPIMKVDIKEGNLVLGKQVGLRAWGLGLRAWV